MRRIAIALAVLGTMALGAGSAQAAVITSSGGVISYVAGQGERNDLVVGTNALFAGTVPVYTFKDNNAIPIQIGGGPCETQVDGSVACRQEFVGSFAIDVRDRDDTVTIATSGTGTVPPLTIGALIIGGRGNDVLLGGLGNDILKGNDGRDSLRGREGADVYKGGRGRDNLQTLDGAPDKWISCGDGGDDVVRKDAKDPSGHHCESSNHKNISKP